MKRLFYGFLAAVLMILPLSGLFAQDRGLSLQVKTQSGEQVAQFGEAHALVIGESAYTNGWNRLPGVKEDVTAVKRLFEEIGFHVETIQDANSNDLSSGIKTFLDNYGYNKDARLIVYFAGHGATLTLGTNSKMGYIVPVDAPLPSSDERTFKQRAIAMDQFKSWATTYDACHILFIFDSCFSGTVFRSMGAPPPAINRLIAQPVRQFITAGAADEEVPDESVFRKQLEAALRYGLADANNDGYISGTELGLYLYNTVANYMNGRQNPQQGKLNDPNLDKGDFIFAVGTQRSAQSTVQATPQPTPQPSAPSQPVATGGSITVESEIAGEIFIDGQATGRRIKAGGTETISNVSTGSTEVAVKGNDGKIVKAAQMVMVRQGQTVKATVPNTPAQPKVVSIKVTGDINNIIAGAYTEFLTSRGLRITRGEAYSYLLDVSFTLEDIDLQNNYKYVRYRLNCSLKNKAGDIIFSSSESGREGHLTREQARQRAINAAEQTITYNNSGFAAKFDAFLTSLF